MNCPHCNHQYVGNYGVDDCPVCGKTPWQGSRFGFLNWALCSFIVLLPAFSVFILLITTPVAMDVAFEVGLIVFGGSFVSGTIGALMLSKLLRGSVWNRTWRTILIGLGLMALSLGLCYVGCIIPMLMEAQAHLNTP